MPIIGAMATSGFISGPVPGVIPRALAISAAAEASRAVCSLWPWLAKRAA
jgi:hypothetical protein